MEQADDPGRVLGEKVLVQAQGSAAGRGGRFAGSSVLFIQAIDRIGRDGVH